MEHRYTPEQVISNLEPDAYKRFSQPGVKYLLPLTPSSSHIKLKQPHSSFEGMNLTNTEHTSANPIPVYTLPEINPVSWRISNTDTVNSIKTSVKKLSGRIPAFQKLESMITNEDEYAYRGARVQASELALETEEPQLNKLISLATYGLDYPP